MQQTLLDSNYENPVEFDLIPFKNKFSRQVADNTSKSILAIDSEEVLMIV